MKLFDSHCHLQYDSCFNNIAEHIVQISKELDIIICVSTELNSIYKINDIVTRFSNDDFTIYSTVGVHPLSTDAIICHDNEKNNMSNALALSDLKHSQIIKYTKNALKHHINQAKNLIAIGETGLDDFRNPLTPLQIPSFAAHLQIAIEYDLPIILHTRCGEDSAVEQECKKLIDQYPDARIIGHCFGGSMEFMKFLVDRGHMISFACNIGYKSAINLREVAKQVPIQNLLIETDSPFLSPQHQRGQPNSPVNVSAVLDVLSALHNIDRLLLLQQLRKNLYNIMKIC